jgi:hypothetical protein
MSMKHWLILTVTFTAGLTTQPLFADDQPGPVPSNAAPLVVAPPAEPEQPAKKKKSTPAKKPAAAPKKSVPAISEPLKATPVTPGPAIVTQPNVNVRGQAAINSEVIVRLKKGDRVNVLKEITLKKPKTDEPAKWAKVALPTNATVWVNSTFINPADKTVTPKKLKVRSGPGENYSVLAIINKGTVVKDIETKGDWMKIEAPAEASGYIAAHLLSNEAAAPPPPVVVAAIEPPKPPPVETKIAPPITPVPATEPVVIPPVTPPPPANTAAVVPPPPVTTPAEPATPAPPAEEILVKRVVSREGIVKRSVSIQAPTYFALESLDTGKTINYLFSPATNVVLKDFRGKRIVVTGEEMLDERWPNTPVINVDTLQSVP